MSNTTETKLSGAEVPLTLEERVTKLEEVVEQLILGVRGLEDTVTDLLEIVDKQQDHLNILFSKIK